MEFGSPAGALVESPREGVVMNEAWTRGHCPSKCIPSGALKGESHQNSQEGRKAVALSPMACGILLVTYWNSSQSWNYPSNSLRPLERDLMSSLL